MTGLYIRVSTQEQAQNGHSIDEQTERLKKYCEAMGWPFLPFIDAGQSGSNLNRPAMQNLIEAVKCRRIDRVLVYKLDRLTRSQRDALYLLEDVFDRNGCAFVSMSESFDTSTPLGKAMIGILAAFAQLEREQIRERMTMGKEARIKQGKWTGGITPYGYDYDKQNGVLVVNESEAVLVRELFEQAAAGKPLFRIMEDFNAAGYRLRNNTWSMWSIKYMLENRVYCGFIRHRDDWIAGTHQPIIEEQQFDRVARILAENRRHFAEQGIPAGGKTISTLLGGILRCGVCGGKYGKRQSSSPPHRHYTYVCYSRMKKVRTMIKSPDCKNKIYRVDELDEIILNEIRKLRLDPNLFEQPEQDKEKPRLIEAELDSIEKQISRLIDLYASGRFSLDTLDRKTEELERRRESLQRQLAAPPITTEEARIALDSFDEVIDSGDLSQKRALVLSLIEKIVITGDDIDIYWKFENAISE